MTRFHDKTILVTGAGSGIGAACVRRLFAEGASIAAADMRNEAIDNVLSELGNSERLCGCGIDVRTVTKWLRSCLERFNGSETSMG